MCRRKDSEQSEYVKGTTDEKLNLIYEVDNEVKVLENLSLGEHELNLGKLPEGEHSIGIQAEDPETGKRSHRVYVKVKVEGDSQNTYQVTEAKLSGVSTAEEMTDKLNALFVQKAETGFNKVVLPKDGSYTIDGSSGGLKLPSGMTVDLNGSTIKMATSTEPLAAIVTMEHIEDAHITGGSLEGDKGEAGALGAAAVRIKGSVYCTVSNMQIKNISGDAYVTERVESEFSLFDDRLQ